MGAGETVALALGIGAVAYGGAVATGVVDNPFADGEKQKKQKPINNFGQRVRRLFAAPQAVGGDGTPQGNTSYTYNINAGGSEEPFNGGGGGGGGEIWGTAPADSPSKKDSSAGGSSSKDSTAYFTPSGEVAAQFETDKQFTDSSGGVVGVESSELGFSYEIKPNTSSKKEDSAAAEGGGYSDERGASGEISYE